MLQNLSIARKGLLVILLPILCQTALLGFIFHQQEQMQEAQHWALHTKDVLLQIDRLVGGILQIQSGLLGYAMTGSQHYAEDEQRMMTQIGGMMNRLQRMVADNPEQSARAAALQASAQRRLDWNLEMDRLIRAGRVDDVRTKFDALEGKALIDDFIKEVDSFRDHEEEMDRQRLAALDSRAIGQNRLLALGMVITLTIGIVAILLLSRGLTQRIAVLRENANRFTRGERLAVRVKGTDEISELDHTFHEMAETVAAGQQNELGLKRALEKQNGELLAANRDLDQKNRENEMFVYSVSHDLRSPLVNLQGFSRELGSARDAIGKMLEGEMQEAERARARKILEHDISEPIRFIQTAVTRLSSIIDALLRLSRAGRVEYRGETVDLNAIVVRIQDAMRVQIAAKGAEIVALPLPPAFGDPTALEQVLANLIGNAVNYLDPARPGHIEIGAVAEPDAEHEGMQVLFVKDNGLGIQEAYLPKVFTVFQRLHGNVAPGEGIGLALVRRMVERHGGRIWVESKENAGTTFYVALPVREKSPLMVAPKKESTKLNGPAHAALPT